MKFIAYEQFSLDLGLIIRVKVVLLMRLGLVKIRIE